MLSRPKPRSHDNQRHFFKISPLYIEGIPRRITPRSSAAAATPRGVLADRCIQSARNVRRKIVSRSYDISDFASFLRKYGDSGHDRLDQTEDSLRDGSRRAGPDRERQHRSSQSRNGHDRSRTIYRGRGREYALRESEVQTLTDLGKFRIVPADDLARLAYRGDRSRMESDLHSLSRQGLIEQRSIEGHSSYSTRVLTLTKDGHRLLERAQLVSNRQALYHGLVKPKEARHDADLYRLYHKVAREIDDVGGKVCRVVLDYELKKELYKKLSQVDPNKDLAYERIRVANEYDLKVVNDKIPVPDLRIEYEDDCREIRRLDLEIATRDYRPQGLAEKAKAGFHLFARQQDHPKLRRVLDTQEITARIFALCRSFPSIRRL